MGKHEVACKHNFPGIYTAATCTKCGKKRCPGCGDIFTPWGGKGAVGWKGNYPYCSGCAGDAAWEDAHSR